MKNHSHPGRHRSPRPENSRKSHTALKHKRSTPPAARWLWMSAGLLLILGIGTTGATRIDNAALRLGGQTGIGAPPFSIATVLPDNTIAHANPEESLTLPIPGKNALVPGRTITFQTTVFNNTETLPSATQVSVIPIGTGAVGNAPNITPFVRITIVNSLTNELIVGNSTSNPQEGATIQNASGNLGTLTPLGFPALPNGTPLTTPLPPQSTTTITVMIHLSSSVTPSFNGGLTALALQFTGTSTTP
ncbi:hypothetical protein [Lysinibacter sp. HNR]|uniref:hypothetical protein n=1 Tax=Lysinibacter sp. HNR TaxID=3031408 RepID=UPI0024358C64|nr:hypothetical protein [Lysinibacter sp. HNR]WGD37917.1 hypothetical protein FrondiHNR_03105 [Lysinibacter sp. HNR]